MDFFQSAGTVTFIGIRSREEGLKGQQQENTKKLSIQRKKILLQPWFIILKGIAFFQSIGTGIHAKESLKGRQVKGTVAGDQYKAL